MSASAQNIALKRKSIGTGVGGSQLGKHVNTILPDGFCATARKVNTMEQQITGRFETKDNADAAAALIGEYIPSADISVVDMLPPSRQDAEGPNVAAGEAPDADGAGRSALGTGVAAGLAAGAIGAIGGPVVALVAAGTGAYLGSLAGALDGLEDHADPLHSTEPGTGGVVLSVRVEDAVDEPRVVASLREAGAEDIGEAHGA